jgi:hypothetical protein
MKLNFCGNANKHKVSHKQITMTNFWVVVIQRREFDGNLLLMDVDNFYVTMNY